MRGTLETIVGAMFAGKTSELLKRILWAEHQGNRILVIKSKIDNRYSEGLISTHNNLTHDCFPMNSWENVKSNFNLSKENYDILFMDEIQFMVPNETIDNVEEVLQKGIDVVCAGLDQDSRGKPWETSSLLLGLADKITKIYGFCNVCGLEATKTFRKASGGKRTQVGASDIYEPRCLKHWESK